MFKRELRITGDGSHTFHIPEWNEQYHSKHGAIQEALHVYIKEGLHYKLQENPSAINLLEMGFGSGLNCLLSYLESETKKIKLHYTSVDAYPLLLEEVKLLNFHTELAIPQNVFLQFHKTPWNKIVSFSDCFSLTKKQALFENVDFSDEFDLIYFDVFGIRVQPELWTVEIFKKMYEALKSGGALITYASNGQTRRNLQNVNFKVEKLKGPPGKKEMIRALKPF